MAHIRSEVRKGIIITPWTFVILVTVAVIFCHVFETATAAPANLTDFSKIEDRRFARNNGSLESQNHTGITTGPVILGGTDDESLEYEPNLILRCEANGSLKPNVSWEYNGKSLANIFLIKQDENAHIASNDELDNVNDPDLNISNEPINNNNNKNNDKAMNLSSQPISLNNDLKKNASKGSWVDFKLPKMNMAFYGTFVCKAVNEDGVSTKSYLIVPNANSSVFMKLVRASIAILSLLVSVAIYRSCQIYRARRKVQRYEKLPSQDYQIIQRFRKGIPMILIPNTSGNIFQLNQCLSTTARIGESIDDSIVTLHSTETDVEINSWVNYTAYDDRKDILKDSFKIDFENLIENTEYGLLLPGNFRSPKTMTWKPVAVKTGKTDRDDISILEGLLAELKVLATLTEENDFIVNLQAAFTHKLYKRQVYVFVDLCKNGSLDKYIDLHRINFRDIFAEGQNEVEMVTQPPKKKFRIVSNFNDENANASPTSEQKAWRFSTEELVVWSAEISDGMRYLHKNKITHGNLCAANVFLTDGLVAKIGNIGHQPNESHKDNRRFPPECKLKHEFSVKSDVWAFGMTLWEIFTLRQQQLPTDQDLAEFYSIGKRLISPRHSNKEMNELLYLCWNPEESLRPDFEHLSESVRLILSTFGV